jgi:hypothetical protein
MQVCFSIFCAISVPGRAIFENMSVFPHPAFPYLVCALVSLLASPALAQEAETPGETGNVPAETPAETPVASEPAAQPERPPGVEGPLYTVAPEVEDPARQAAEVREIYRESDRTFANVLWWWVVLIAVLSALGYGAYWLWGRRVPRPPSGR